MGLLASSGDAGSWMTADAFREMLDQGALALAEPPRTDADRRREALVAMDDALRNLTRAICLLGDADGKEFAQRAHQCVHLCGIEIVRRGIGA